MDNTLRLLINAKDNASRTLKSVEGHLNSVSNSAKKAGQSLKFISAGAAAGLGFAAKQAISFQKQIANIGTLIGTGEELNKLEGDIRSLSMEYGMSADRVALASYNMISASVDVKDAAKFTEQAIILSKTGLGDITDATRILTSAQRAFASEGLEVDQVAQIMFNTIKNGVTTLPELVNQFGDTAAIVNDTGISMASFMSVVAASTSVGLKASKVYTGVKAAISGMIRPTEESEYAFKELSAESGQAIKTFDDLVAINKGDLYKSLMDLGRVLDWDKDKIQSMVGSVDAVGLMMILKGQGPAETYANAMKTAGNETELARQQQEAMEIQMATFGAKWDILKANINEVAIQIGNILLPYLEKAVEWMRKGVKWFSELDESTKKIIVGITAFVAAAAPMLLIFGTLSSSLGKIIGFLGTFGSILKGGLMAVGLGVIAGAVVLIAKNFSLIMSQVSTK